MTKEQFIDKVVELFELKDFDKQRVSVLLDTYKSFLQEQNKITNLTRLDKEDII